MQPLDADGGGPAALELDDDLGLADDRRLVLADLIALRKVRKEIVFAIEHRAQIDFCVQPEPVRTAWRTHSSLMTGSMPGIAASTSETWLLGSPPNAVEAPENSFEFEATWAWISMPIT